ncbi:Carbohydrate esterase family 1 and carbohydrate-binding module family 1 protein [Mycena venus]|uniref:Carbohydrate esterase family 1 and carbohydrate-binding module family 1 protein n=1 Tax=Mycena venus TaxID=2733690 RepID=A0A8H6XYX2_9AGAR|nr:Carbohydrate esterase family 1 and carbohydrate-binding module family 1 protein [Mycena venus]
MSMHAISSSQKRRRPSGSATESQSLDRLEGPPRKRRAPNHIVGRSIPGSTSRKRRKSTARKTINSLPTEILMEIFEMAVPPDYFLRGKPRYFGGPVRPKPGIAWRESMTTKRTIVSVCKTWCSIGRRLLYRDVTILDLPSLSALSWTLRTGNPDLGGLVRGLSFFFRTVRDRDDWAAMYINAFLPLCTRVRRVDFYAYGGSWYPPANIFTFPILPSSVTSLGIGFHARLADFGTDMLQQTAHRLQELRVPFEALAGEKFASLKLSLPRLRTLQLACSGHHSERASLADWTMPQLRRVTFRTWPEWTGMPPLRRHDDGQPSLEEELDYGKLLALCPALQHVVLPSWAAMDAGQAFPTVRWLDLWCATDAPAADGTPENEIALPSPDLTHWPNVERIRRFDVALRDTILDLPAALDPRVRWGGDDAARYGLEPLPSENAPGDPSSANADSDEAGEEGRPRPVLRPGLRRFLRATMPKRLFARFERAQVTNYGTNPTNVGMFVYKPTTVTANPAVIVAIHYCGGTAQAYFTGSPYAQYADTYGFIVIYPNSPNSGTCWDVSSVATLTHNGGGDSLGIRNQVAYAISTYGADPSRIFVTGTSSGAMMTNVLAAVYPDVFAAAIVYSGVAAGCFMSSFGGVDAWNSSCSEGLVSQTSAQWAAQVHAMYPGYTGPYPPIQEYHGTADTTLYPENLGEEIKEWAGIFGYNAAAPTQVLQNTPLSGYTKSIYGPALQGISAAGVGHTVPIQGNEDMKWFGFVAGGAAPAQVDRHQHRDDEHGGTDLPANDDREHTDEHADGGHGATLG